MNINWKKLALDGAKEIEHLTRERDAAQRSCMESEAERNCLEATLSRYEEALREALNEYVSHQAWRCDHPDRYPLDEVDPPDCPCGLHQFELRARALLQDGGEAEVHKPQSVSVQPSSK